MTDQADPDFLALPKRHQTRIDRAFDRGLPKLRSSGRKRRKLNDASAARPSTGGEDGGGFMPDMEGEGGFMEGVDVEGGGFMPDGSDGGGFMEEDQGGFLPDDGDDPGPSSRPALPASPPASGAQTPRSGKVPLSSIPRLLGLLNLPADEDVLAVFKASATGWTVDEDNEAGPRRTRRGGAEGEDQLGVERKDFRAVCAAIMDGAEEDEGMDIDAESPPGEADSGESDSGSDEDAFELDEGSELSSLSSDSEYGASRKKTRASAGGSAPRVSGSGRKGKAKESDDAIPTKTKRKKGASLEEQGPLKLVGRQREMARELWEMMKGAAGQEVDASKRGRRGESSAHVLGREEVKKWVREMGEMWTEDEVSDYRQ